MWEVIIPILLMAWHDSQSSRLQRSRGNGVKSHYHVMPLPDFHSKHHFACLDACPKVPSLLLSLTKEHEKRDIHDHNYAPDDKPNSGSEP